jgi:hypothetical protein
MAGIGCLLRLCFSVICKASRLITFAILIGSSLQAQVTFRKPDFDTGKGPIAIAAADLNRDGFPDVVTANQLDNSISVLLNNGDSTFSSHVDYPTGKSPTAVIAADLNSDGIPDVAVVNSESNSISIFLGSADGTLRPFATMPIGPQPNALVAADFNRDGKVDLAVLNQGDGTLSIYLGSGDGRFQHSADYALGNCSFGANFEPGNLLVAGDFNNDSMPDLAIATGNASNGCSPAVTIFGGKGDGTFSIIGSIPGASAPLLTGDFNHNGNLDLVAQHVVQCGDRSCTWESLIFAGHGDGTFDQGHPMPCQVSSPEFGLRLAIDLNGDHVPDLAGGCLVLIDPATVFTKTPVELPMPPTGLIPLAMTGGDFNGDGKSDIVTANFSDSTISLLSGNGDGTFHQPLRYVPILAGISEMASADLNDDGIPDLVVGGFLDPGALIYFGNGDGTLRQPVKIVSDLHVLEIAIGDVNGDRVSDIVVGGWIDPQAPTMLRVLPGKGDGTFAAPIESSEPLADGKLLADFNGDHILDLAFTSITGDGQMAISVQFGNGDGTFRPPMTGAVVNFVPSAITLGDFNGDGIPDIIVRDALQDGDIAVLPGNGDGTFRVTTIKVVPPIGDIAVGDFNHDGKMDFVAPPYVFLGNGDGTFRQQGSIDVFLGKTRVADVNGDGIPDLIGINEGQISVLIGNGDGTFQPALRFSVGGARDFVLGDFDSDGHPDIAVSNVGAISMLLSSKPVPIPPPDFKLALSAASIAVKAGQSSTVTISVTAIGRFNSGVTFSCAGLPAGAACSFNPASLTPSANGTSTSTLTITTGTAPKAALSYGSPDFRNLGFVLGVPCAGIVLLGFRRRPRWKASVLLVGLLLAMLILGGCAGLMTNSSSGTGGNGGNSGNLTPSGVYTVTVVGNSNGSPAITHSQRIVLTVH